MVAGLSHVHEKGFVHLDLKPENILISKHFEIKLSDFGLAQDIGGEDGNGTFDSIRVGSYSYWSPEQILGYEYNGVKSDLYALGIILFIIVFGCRPFAEAKLSDNLFNTLLHNPRLFWEIHPLASRRIQDRDVSSSVVRLLDGMLCPNPERRLTLQEIKSHEWLKEEEFDYRLLSVVKDLNMKVTRAQAMKLKCSAFGACLEDDLELYLGEISPKVLEF